MERTKIGRLFFYNATDRVLIYIMYLTVVYLNTTQGYRLSKGHRPNLKRLLHHLVRATFSLI